MKWFFISTTFFIVSICLIGCVRMKPTYMGIMAGENSQVVFRLGADEKLSKPAKVQEIRVYSTEHWGSGRWRWHIIALDPPIPPEKYNFDYYRRHRALLPLMEVVYGVVPEGFTEVIKAVPLEPYAKYDVRIESPLSGASIEATFINKPGEPEVLITPENRDSIISSPPD